LLILQQNSLLLLKAIELRVLVMSRVNYCKEDDDAEVQLVPLVALQYMMFLQPACDYPLFRQLLDPKV
jgi:hypothetical protein